MNTYTQGADIIIEATFYDSGGEGRAHGTVTCALQYLSDGATQFHWYDWASGGWSVSRGTDEELSEVLENPESGYAIAESGEGGYIVSLSKSFTASLPAGIYKWEMTIADTPQDKESGIFELSPAGSIPNIPAYQGVGLTLRQMQDEVSRRCFKDTATFRTMITGWLNEAQQRIVTLVNGRWWWAEASATVEASQYADRFIAPPDFFEFVDKASLTDTTNDVILKRIEHEQFETEKTSKYGQPSTYCLFDKTTAGARYIRLNPPADSARVFKLDYYKVVPDLKNDSDVSHIPYWYHYLLIEFAVMRGQEHRQQAEMAQLARSQWLDGVLQLLIESDKKNDRQPQPVIRWR